MTTTAVLQLEVIELQQTVARLGGDLATAHRDIRQLRELAAAQADRLQIAQTENEGASRHAYEAAAGPHFCKGQPFGTPPAVGSVVSGDDVAHWIDSHMRAERDPARRAAWRTLRDTERSTP